jgi:hypothetical protein
VPDITTGDIQHFGYHRGPNDIHQMSFFDIQGRCPKNPNIHPTLVNTIHKIAVEGDQKHGWLLLVFQLLPNFFWILLGFTLLFFLSMDI